MQRYKTLVCLYLAFSLLYLVGVTLGLCCLSGIGIGCWSRVVKFWRSTEKRAWAVGRIKERVLLGRITGKKGGEGSGGRNNEKRRGGLVCVTKMVLEIGSSWREH